MTVRARERLMNQTACTPAASDSATFADRLIFAAFQAKSLKTAKHVHVLLIASRVAEPSSPPPEAAHCRSYNKLPITYAAAWAVERGQRSWSDRACHLPPRTENTARWLSHPRQMCRERCAVSRKGFCCTRPPISRSTPSGSGGFLHAPCQGTPPGSLMESGPRPSPESVAPTTREPRSRRAYPFRCLLGSRRSCRPCFGRRPRPHLTRRPRARRGWMREPVRRIERVAFSAPHRPGLCERKNRCSRNPSANDIGRPQLINPDNPPAHNAFRPFPENFVLT